MTRLGALLLATGVIAAGCGGDDELGPLDDADAAAVAALVIEFEQLGHVQLTGP